MRLVDKAAFITGADSGIGQAIAIAFASEGADVAICYRSDKKGADETASIVKKLGRKCLVLKVDVTKEKLVESALDKTLKHFGKLDILVNNAAVNGSNIPLHEMPTKVFKTTIETNLYGVFYACRWFSKNVAELGNRGKIINISSIHEDIAVAGNSDYNASKGAVRMLMRTLALELAPKGVTVNNIGPGMILTPMNQQAMDNKSIRDEMAQNIPMHRPGEPQEVAKLAVFLASVEGDYVTGSTYFIDGGLMINSGQGA
ncbi:SDR family oxidoreductase [Flavobacterium sp.]|uniref:SDR family NAD(P)-dependent oxidoreductase n=1 Tax=Flavobacterium sp. TaxID=239 RepID=UPI001228AF7C|nr:SDR family oxidoreductase [Flavobacterium sp.]RZJ72132.1 MAG: SDR family oxidoreductase [Flavobacterium sp.]